MRKKTAPDPTPDLIAEYEARVEEAQAALRSLEARREPLAAETLAAEKQLREVDETIDTARALGEEPPASVRSQASTLRERHGEQVRAVGKLDSLITVAEQALKDAKAVRGRALYHLALEEESPVVGAVEDAFLNFVDKLQELRTVSRASYGFGRDAGIESATSWNRRRAVVQRFILTHLGRVEGWSPLRIPNGNRCDSLRDAWGVYVEPLDPVEFRDAEEQDPELVSTGATRDEE